MKHKLITFAGIMMFLVGAAALDGPDWITGLIAVFAGLGVSLIGQVAEKDPTGGSPRSQ